MDTEEVEIYHIKDMSDGTCLVYKQSCDVSLIDEEVDINSVQSLAIFPSRYEANKYIFDIMLNRTIL